VASMTEAAFAPAWDPEACADLAIWPWQSVVPPKRSCVGIETMARPISPTWLPPLQGWLLPQTHG
jgi:hypothetical protein